MGVIRAAVIALEEECEPLNHLDWNSKQIEPMYFPLELEGDVSLAQLEIFSMVIYFLSQNTFYSTAYQGMVLKTAPQLKHQNKCCILTTKPVIIPIGFAILSNVPKLEISRR